jgi:aarF domain-containing kinase
MPDKNNITLDIPLAEDRIAAMSSWQYIVWKAKLVLRTISLMILFTPSLILSPLLYLAPDLWCSIFAYSVELAGPVFIKLAQYVSTRGDLFSDMLSSKFVHLREHCRTHSLAETNDLF